MQIFRWPAVHYSSTVPIQANTTPGPFTGVVPHYYALVLIACPVKAKGKPESYKLGSNTCQRIGVQ